MSASCSVGSNGSPLSPKDVRPSLAAAASERLRDRLEAAGQLAVLPGPADVVEHRQQLRAARSPVPAPGRPPGRARPACGSWRTRPAAAAGRRCARHSRVVTSARAASPPRGRPGRPDQPAPPRRSGPPAPARQRPRRPLAAPDARWPACAGPGRRAWRRSAAPASAGPGPPGRVPGQSAGSIRLRSRITGPWCSSSDGFIRRRRPPGSACRHRRSRPRRLVVVLASSVPPAASPACALAACDWA